MTESEPAESATNTTTAPAETAAATAQVEAQQPAAATADEEPAAIFPMSKEEKHMEQKMIKIISRMPPAVQDRFKCLHVFSDERSKINDEFEKEVRELSESFELRKVPILEKRDKILAGTETAFDDACNEFDTAMAKCETIVAGIVKSEEEKAADEEENKAHVPTDV